MPNKAERAYDVLERMITFQELPPGSVVSEARLMERTGLGRTPVREALQRLARERMVEIHPGQGVMVASASIEAQLKVLEVRRSLEELAVRLAAHRATTSQRERSLELVQVHGKFDSDNLEEYGDLLKETHTLIVDAAHNEYLSLAMAPLQGLAKRFWFARVRDPKSQVRAASELHGDILHAVCHGDGAKASTASLKLNDYLTDFTYQALRSGPDG